MSAHLKTHLIFYGAAVTIVLGLFRLTSAYGEANLQAPPNVNGYYLTTEALPGCPADSRLAITVQQSGIYLNGALSLASLESASNSGSTPEQLTLNGRWQQQQARLTGSTAALADCQIPAAPVTLQGSITETPPAFTGQLVLNATPPWQFTANRQAQPTETLDH